MVSLILAATSVDQGVFVPMQTCATLAINLVTGLVVWEDYKVVEKWIAYIMVHCPGHTQWAHSLHCRPATGCSEAERAWLRASSASQPRYLHSGSPPSPLCVPRLGGYLSNSKDLKDFFVELVEIAEWLRSLTFTAEEAAALVDLVTHALPAGHFSALHVECWKRFMRGASGCMLLMYARVPGTSLSFLGP